MDASGGRKVFVFDRVFGEEEGQEEVFDYLAESVSSFVQGYNVSVMAYGQSGAGKSYTMVSQTQRNTIRDAAADNHTGDYWAYGPGRQQSNG